MSVLFVSDTGPSPHRTPTEPLLELPETPKRIVVFCDGYDNRSLLHSKSSIMWSQYMAGRRFGGAPVFLYQHFGMYV